MHQLAEVGIHLLRVGVVDIIQVNMRHAHQLCFFHRADGGGKAAGVRVAIEQKTRPLLQAGEGAQAIFQGQRQLVAVVTDNL